MTKASRSFKLLERKSLKGGREGKGGEVRERGEEKGGVRRERKRGEGRNLADTFSCFPQLLLFLLEFSFKLCVESDFLQS